MFYLKFKTNMKSLELESLGVVEMNSNDIINTDGGFLPLVVIGVALLVSSCYTTQPSRYGGANPEKSIPDSTSKDSTNHK